jgi:putative DNA primase/helicase
MKNIKINKIPMELKSISQWVLWKYWNRNGKDTKMPINAIHNKAAMINNPDTWVKFDKAVLNASKIDCDGIGFVLTDSTPYTVIDLDNVRDPITGVINEDAMNIINALESYTEISPSGKGIHIWVKGKCKMNRRKGNFEVYDSNRYMTVTGNHLEGTPITINERQHELCDVCNVAFAEDQPPGVEILNIFGDTSLSDSEVIDKAKSAKNGEKFTKLWEGDWAGDYPSQSEAGAGLLHILAYWCGPKEEQIDRLFRQSELCRDKWDEPRGDTTWGALEIKKALARVTDYYNPYHDFEEDAVSTAITVQETNKVEDITIVIDAIPLWPHEVMAGAAGNFAKTYSEYLETPPQFLYIIYITFLGYYISANITLYSALETEPRLYTVITGPSGDSRKSTAVHQTESLFKAALGQERFNIISGAGSAEGLATKFARNPRLLLILDELKSLIQKMRIDGSVLLPVVSTLFEQNYYYNVIKAHEINIPDAKLSVLGACTIETYRNMFTPQFLDIGFINRLFVVIGEGQRKFSIPEPIPLQVKEDLKHDLLDVMDFVKDLAKSGSYAMPISPEARKIFDCWYFSCEKSVFSKRLETYGHRLMLLLAVNEKKDTVTPDIAQKIVALLNYELAARKYADPIDADNKVAKVEGRIKQLLARGPMTKRMLEANGHKNRVGIWIWKTALKNLIGAKEVEEIPQGRSCAYRLISE